MPTGYEPGTVTDRVQDIPNSPYELLLSERQGYLHAMLRAPAMTEYIATHYFPRVAAEADRLRLNRVMILRDVPTSLQAGTLYRVTADLVGLMKGKKIAFVNPYPQIREEINFSITVSTNRGGNYRLFESESDAEGWLLAE